MGKAAETSFLGGKLCTPNKQPVPYVRRRGEEEPGDCAMGRRAADSLERV